MSKKSIKNFTNIFITYLPAIVLVVLGFWFASQYITPAVPKNISVSAGHENGAYYKYAKAYQEELKKDGITLKIITSSGSLENVNNLLNNKADIAFVQGGVVSSLGVDTQLMEEDLVSLGSLYYEPIWVFINSALTLDKLKKAASLRIAIGPNGSGTKSVANRLLQLDNITENVISLPYQDAVDNILLHEIDVAFFVTSENTPIIQKLLHDERVYLMPIKRAQAYSRLLPYLSKVVLYEGVINLHKNIPEQDIPMIAATANLVVNKELHSTLQVLLLRAAKKIHNQPGLFSDAGDFPSTYKVAYPISEIADRFYKVGSPFLMRYLPFNVAIYIDRMIVLLIPLLALMLPLMKITPSIYRWRIRSNVYRWYEELLIIEGAMFISNLTANDVNKFLEKIKIIELQVNKIKTPLSNADQLFNLLLHIDMVKNKLNGIEA